MVGLFFRVLKVSALVNSNEILYVDTCFKVITEMIIALNIAAYR